MPPPPDYTAIQRGWLTAFRWHRDFATVRSALIATEDTAAQAQTLWDQQAPTFRSANEATARDLAQLLARLAVYRGALEGDPSAYPWVMHALMYGSTGLDAWSRVAPPDATKAVRDLGLARHRGDLSRSIGMVWYISEGSQGWTSAAWDGWVSRYIVGPVAEALTVAGIDVDAERILRDVTGMTARERRMTVAEGLAVGLGVVGGVAALRAAWRR